MYCECLLLCFSHLYTQRPHSDRVSLTKVTDAFGDDVEDETEDSQADTAKPTNVEKSENVGVPTSGSRLELIKQEMTKQIRTSKRLILKIHPPILLGALGGEWPKSRNFPWITMPTTLANLGIICENYPESVAFPGDKPLTAAKSKGISDLSQSELGILIAAFQDPNHPLRFKLAKKNQRRGKYLFLVMENLL
jgi:hypothetical protein